MASALPLASVLLCALLVLWLWHWPQQSWLGWAGQCLAGLAVGVAAWLAAIWTLVPRWSLGLLLLVWLAATLHTRRRAAPGSMAPKAARDWLASAAALALLGLSSWVVVESLRGQHAPAGPTISLALPLVGDDLAVANGGSRLLINAHQDTLDLSVPRHRLWHGQSYGVDFVALHPWGTTATGWQPADPARYAIFGRPVRAPCSGHIIRLQDGRPDLPVPQIDLVHMAGNFVVLRCGRTEVAMAHLKRGTIVVQAGQPISAGMILAQVGNSGASSEPHLHINAQTPGTDAAPFSGKPVVMLFNGAFLARNDRI
jgi:hypothetical protein